MKTLHLSCVQTTADEPNEAVRANRTYRTCRALTQGVKTVWCKHRESQDREPGRSGSVKSVWEGRSDIESNAGSCICHRSSSSSSSSSTWTEPPSRSAVRCDPKVSLLVTGVGWDSLPLGSGDLTQRAKRVEAGGREVVRRRRGGEKKVVGWRARQCGGTGEREYEMLREKGQEGGGVN